jgi:hypothetical protein
MLRVIKRYLDGCLTNSKRLFDGRHLMKFKNLKGKEVNLNISKYLIDWDKKERSIIQFKVKKFLQPYWKYHVVLSELRIVSTRMTFDLFNVTLGIAVETQGKQHGEYNSFFHKGARANYLSQIKRDNDKINFCQINGFRMIEIQEDDVKHLSREMLKEVYDLDL